MASKKDSWYENAGGVPRVKKNLGFIAHQSQDSSTIDYEAINTFQPDWYEQLQWYNQLPEEWKQRVRNNPYASQSLNRTGWEGLFPGKFNDKMLALEQAFDQYNTNIYDEYLEWKNSLPSTQVGQQLAAGINSALNGGVDNSSLEASMPDGVGPAGIESADSAAGIFAAVQTIGSVVSGVFGLISAGAELTAKSIANKQSRVQLYKSVDSAIEEFINNKYHLDSNGRFIPAEKANLPNFGDRVLNDYARRSYASRIGSAGGVIQSSGVHKALADVVVDDAAYGNASEYVNDYINLQMRIAKLRTRYERLQLESSNSRMLYDKSLYDSLDPDLKAGSSNARDFYDKMYYGSLDSDAAASRFNRSNQLDKQMLDIRFSALSEFRRYVNTLRTRSLKGDITATQLLCQLIRDGLLDEFSMIRSNPLAYGVSRIGSEALSIPPAPTLRSSSPVNDALLSAWD